MKIWPLLSGFVYISGSFVLAQRTNYEEGIQASPEDDNGGWDYYRPDGLGNSRDSGAARRPYRRHGNSHSYDDLPGQVQPDLPSAAEVSRRIFAFSPHHPHPSVSVLYTGWGQMIMHDIVATQEGTEPMPIPLPTQWQCNVPPLPIVAGTFSCPSPEAETPESIPFNRSHYEVGDDNVRVPVNTRTAWLDGSSLYGVEREAVMALREGRGGRLKMDDEGFPPRVPGGDKGCELFAFAQGAVNLHPVLTSIGIVMVREHNRYAKLLESRHPDWDDEAIFREAKAWVVALIQKITFYWYLPILLGSPLPSWQAHNATIDPQVDVFNAATAFRYGHFAISDTVFLLSAHFTTHPLGHQPLLATIRRPCAIREAGVEPVLRGAMVQPEEKMEAVMGQSVRLASPADLPALNIQRNRDWGVALYNDMREAYGLHRVSSLEELVGRDRSDLLEALEDMYDGIDAVEAYVGAMLEPLELAKSSGYDATTPVVPPLIAVSIRDAFTRLRSSDRFWHEQYLPYLRDSIPYETAKKELPWFPFRDVELARDLATYGLTELLLNNTRLCWAPPNPFRIESFANAREGLQKTMKMDTTLPKWTQCDEGAMPEPFTSTRRQSLTFLSGQYQLEWEVRPPNMGDGSAPNRMDITISGRTSGWVGLGVSPDGRMIGADLLIGWIDADTAAPVLHRYTGGPDRYPVAVREEMDIDTQTVSGREMVVNGESWTTLSFSRPLRWPSGDGKAIKLGETTTILVAFGPEGAKELRFHGSRRQVAMVDFASGRSTVMESSKSVLYVHGLIMWFLASILIPGSFCSVRYFKHREGWLNMHERLALMSMSNMIGMAFSALASTNAILATPHSILGLLLVGCIALQTILGISNKYWHYSASKRILPRHARVVLRFLHALLGTTILLASLANSVFGAKALFPNHPIWVVQLLIVLAITCMIGLLEFRRRLPTHFFAFVDSLPPYLRVGVLSPVEAQPLVQQPTKQPKWHPLRILQRLGGGGLNVIGSGEQSFTPDCVCEAVENGSQWVVVLDGVYDIRNFVGSHPGGTALLERHVGCDITALFLGLVVPGSATSDLRSTPRASPITMPRRPRFATIGVTVQAATSAENAPVASPSAPPHDNGTANTGGSGCAAGGGQQVAPCAMASIMEIGRRFSNSGRVIRLGSPTRAESFEPTVVGRPHSVFAACTLRKYRVGTLSLQDGRGEREGSFNPPPSYFPQKVMGPNNAQPALMALLKPLLQASPTPEAIRGRTSTRSDMRQRTLLMYGMLFKHVSNTPVAKAVGGAGSGSSITHSSLVSVPSEKSSREATPGKGGNVAAGLYQPFIVVENTQLNARRPGERQLAIHRITLESATTLSIEHYRPGLHVCILEDIAGRRFKRSYSVAATPSSHLLTFLVKSYPSNGRGMAEFLSSRRQGDTLRLRGFQGTNLLHDAPSVPGMSTDTEEDTDDDAILAFSPARDPHFGVYWPFCAVISAGTGMTPFLNLIRHQGQVMGRLARDPTTRQAALLSQLSVLHVSRHRDEALALGWDEIRSIKATVNGALADAPAPRVTANVVISGESRGQSAIEAIFKHAARPGRAAQLHRGGLDGDNDVHETATVDRQLLEACVPWLGRLSSRPSTPHTPPLQELPEESVLVAQEESPRDPPAMQTRQSPKHDKWLQSTPVTVLKSLVHRAKGGASPTQPTQTVNGTPEQSAFLSAWSMAAPAQQEPSLSAILARGPSPSTARIFICGPASWVHSMRRVLESEMRVPREYVKTL